MKRLQLPLSKEVIRSLKAGEQYYLCGVVYTARDAAHKRLQELYDAKKPLPITVEGQTIYYVGPSQTAPGKIYGSAGPTTSTRMDAYMDMMCDLKMQACIGKGKRSEHVKELFREKEVIYFVTIGGLGALLQNCVRQVEEVAFEDLGAEKISRLTIEDFPVFVGYDVYGGDIYDSGK
ncbi:MAG: fumarate hydratase C-terminal domain-containing protein [Erysipelotrichaceae bacterium]|nr:fumarate hydratase C-terminal domain-containing protein [Erysipelotrichaceae bacterium]